MPEAKAKAKEAGTEPEQNPETGPEATAGDLASILAAEIGEELRRTALRRIFKTPEFNVRDGLDDYDHDYRRRMSLGEVITRDARHRLARRDSPGKPREARPTATAAPPEAETPSASEGSAPVNVEPLGTPPSNRPAPPEPLRFRSRGRVLIVDTDRGEAAGPRAAARLEGVPPGWLLSPPVPGASREALPPGWRRIEGTLTRTDGVLGRFRAWAEVDGEECDLGASTGAETFDLVLDLREEAIPGNSAPPVGYFAPGRDSGALDAALSELPELVGEFESPRFLVFREERCDHGGHRHPGCARCASVCPTGAMTEAPDGMRLDPFRCHECGACAAACPSGALSLEAPWLEQFSDDLGVLLADRTKGSGPAVLLHPEDAAPPPDRVGADVAVPMASVWAAGMELWLAALAAGAHRLRVALPADAPAGLRKELSRQMASARALLNAVGWDQDALGFVSPDAVGEMSAAAAAGPRTVEPPPALAALWRSGDRRESIRRAVAALGSGGTSEATVPLPPGEIFGEIAVATDACTLCLACAGTCPTTALHAGTERPELRFAEAACTQCGQCSQVCPEGAVALRPRYDFEAQRGGERVLHGTTPFCCVRCGTPFSTPRMIERIAARLTGHWMFPDDAALRRVRMCRSCRVADLLESEFPETTEAKG